MQAGARASAITKNCWIPLANTMTKKPKMTSQSKHDTVQGALAAAQFLSELSFREQPTLVKGRYGYSMTNPNRFRYLGRIIFLMRGMDQNRMTQRRSRRRSIEQRAMLIAAETGADYEDVLRFFLIFMSQYDVMES